MHRMICCSSALCYSPCAYVQILLCLHFSFVTLYFSVKHYLLYSIPLPKYTSLGIGLFHLYYQYQQSQQYKQVVHLPTKPKLSSPHKYTVSSRLKFISFLSYLLFPVKFSSHYNSCNTVFVSVIVCACYQNECSTTINFSLQSCYVSCLTCIHSCTNSNPSYSYIVLGCSLVNPSNSQHAQWLVYTSGSCHFQHATPSELATHIIVCIPNSFVSTAQCTLLY